MVTAIPSNKIDCLFDAFNSFNSDIQFTIELENNNQLSFLDVLIVHNSDGSLSTDWYHKTTWSGRYLNFNSHLPLAYKRNTVNLLANKIIQLSDPIFHKTNFGLLKKTLINNGYPVSFIKPILNSFFYNNFLNSNHQPVVNVPNDTKYVTIPYVRSLYEKIRFCLKKYNFRVVGKAHGNFGISLFSNLKDPRGLGNNKNVVYEVLCECEKSYIGQTKQLLNKRFLQHKKDAKRITLGRISSDVASALSTHLYETNHEVYLEDVRILEKETNCTTRRVLEMIHIKKDCRSMNKQSDCKYLQNTYNLLFQ